MWAYYCLHSRVSLYIYIWSDKLQAVYIAVNTLLFLGYVSLLSDCILEPCIYNNMVSSPGYLITPNRVLNDTSTAEAKHCWSKRVLIRELGWTSNYYR